MVDMDVVRNEILQGLLQVDSSFIIDEFSCQINERDLTVDFSAHNSNGEIVEVNSSWD